MDSHSSRLFHTIVVLGAALIAGAAIGCSGDEGGPATDGPTNQSSSSSSPDGGPEVEGGAREPGWAPTK